MAKLIWNQEGQNRYEFSVDRGVFYTYDNHGYVWNGLVSVDESFDGGELVSYHFDGVKYLDVTTPSNYKATISAFSTPVYFSGAIGDLSVVPGFILTRQTRDRFGFSYRTRIGDSDGYKIHIVYNALATPSQRTYSTVNNSATAELYSWAIDAVPPVYSGFHPSAHFVIDSTQMDPNVLSILEDILYGSESIDARLPHIFEISMQGSLLLIIPQLVTGLAQLAPGAGGDGDLYGAFEGFHRALPQTRLKPSTISGLYRLE